MVTQTFPQVVADYSVLPTMDEVVLRYAGSRKTQTILYEDQEWHRPTIIMTPVREAEKKTIRTFLANRRYGGEAFYLLDTLDLDPVDVPLTGVTDGANKDFILPTASVALPDGVLYAGHYPQDDLTLTTVKDKNGDPHTVSSIDEDLRKFVLSVAPAAGLAPMTANYRALRRYKLAGRPAWQKLNGPNYTLTLQLEEDPA